MVDQKSATKVEGRGEGQDCEHHRGVLQYHTIQACSCPYSVIRSANAMTINPREEVHSLHTTVIGIAGALGKMNLTSSNFPRLRQDSARDTLEEVELSQFL